MWQALGQELRNTSGPITGEKQTQRGKWRTRPHAASNWELEPETRFTYNLSTNMTGIFFFFSLWQNICNLNFATVTIVKVRSRGGNYIHLAVRLSPSFTSSPDWHSAPRDQLLHILPSQSLAPTTIPLFVSPNLTAPAPHTGGILSMDFEKEIEIPGSQSTVLCFLLLWMRLVFQTDFGRPHPWSRYFVELLLILKNNSSERTPHWEFPLWLKSYFLGQVQYWVVGIPRQPYKNARL